MGDGQEDGHRRPAGQAEEVGSLDTGGVEDGQHVVHSLLQRGEVGEGDGVGHAGAPLVHDDVAAETGHGSLEAADDGVGVRQLEVGRSTDHAATSGGPTPMTA